MPGSDESAAHQPHEPFRITVNEQSVAVTEHKLTGAQIKAYVPDVPPGTKLSLEGHGNDPDRIVLDDEIVSLDEHQGGPRRFTMVPPANFG